MVLSQSYISDRELYNFQQLVKFSAVTEKMAQEQDPRFVTSMVLLKDVRPSKFSKNTSQDQKVSTP